MYNSVEMRCVSPEPVESCNYVIASENGDLMKKRGQKICEKCGCVNGVRAYYCKECDHPFKMKKPSKSRRGRPVKDWTTLEPGEYVRVVGRSGSYYIRSNGEKIYFTDAGIYNIRQVHEDGITVIGQGRQAHGYEFLYMGKEKKSDLIDNLFNAPHKLLKVNYQGR